MRAIHPLYAAMRLAIVRRELLWEKAMAEGCPKDAYAWTLARNHVLTLSNAWSRYQRELPTNYAVNLAEARLVDAMTNKHSDF